MSDNQSQQRNVFFDLDGTLHQQDLFGSFLRYMIRRLPANLIILIPLLPVIILGLLINGRNSRWPMSLMLWAVTAGQNESRLKWLEQQFIQNFRQSVVPFPVVQGRLAEYLNDENTQVWLLTGSPQRLVEEAYVDSFFLGKVNLVGSQIARRYGGWVIDMRCLGKQKVVELEQRLGKPLSLYSGYSDSIQDDPVLACCQHRWRVDMQGNLKELE
ncbi:acid phosphatase AphA [Budviciaceae bacterium BWR-B9]|uniref:Acid phosphatase AphA n=1 Tax=Limnobaculum allomyrinae TaxID=2791986 RepID=A0ABS1IT15_9GAMM|nr:MULTISPECIES: phosphatidylglycerophosphatase C [Limnobaculum]MBK5144894.1 acid phosphatase AphA [Limnobaculum allomyrinae]MBV7692725.1 phosphatidylglycerophosphatase C [Limnobaculum sp. M2-1]